MAKKAMKLTGKETVEAVLLMHAERYVKKAVAKQVVDQYVAEHKDYITRVLKDKCKDRWAYCQMSFICIERMCLDVLTAA
jgi:hypothetical protein